MDKLKAICSRRFFGNRLVHIGTIAIAVGFVAIVYSTYWMARSDEVYEIVDIVKEYGSTTLNFWDRNTGKKVAIHMCLDD